MFTIKKNYIVLILIIILLYFVSPFLGSKEETKNPEEIFSAIETEVQIALSDVSVISKIKENNFLYITATVFFWVSILIVLTGIGLNVYHFLFRKKIHIPRTEKLSDSNWSVLDVFKIIIIVIFAAFVYYILGDVISNSFKLNIHSSLVNSLIFSTFFHIISIGCVLLYIRYKYNADLSSLGLIFKNKFRNIYIGILGYSSVIPFTVLALIISIMVSTNLGFESKGNPLLLVYFLPDIPFKLGYLLIFISVIGPICEEIFFRGFLYKTLRSKFNVRWGIFLNSIIFSFLHLTPAGFLPIFVLSIMLSYIYEKTGSLIAPVALHIMHNSMISVFLLILRGVVYA